MTDEVNVWKQLFIASQKYIEPFLDQFDQPYAVVTRNGKREILKIGSRRFFHYLIPIALDELGFIPIKLALSKVAFHLAAKASLQGEKRDPIAQEGENILTE